jgi:undecaprenyl-diphosphatase
MNSDPPRSRPADRPPARDRPRASAALVVFVVCALGFAVLLVLLRADALVGFDTALLHAARAIDARTVDGIALEVTSLGSLWVVWLLVLVGSVVLREFGHRDSARLLWIALLGGAALNALLKSLFSRTRPDVFEWRTPYAAHFSFPSGHSMNAMVVYATIAFILARVLPPGPARTAGIAGCLTSIVLVGASRVYLGVHFPSDVIGGFLVGLAWVAACVMVMERRRWGKRSAVGGK